MKTYAISDQGFWRQENQDRFLLKEFEDGTVLAAVADGMGGEAGGGQAAQIAVETFKDFASDFPQVESQLKSLFRSASEKITQKIQGNPELTGMGTTLTAACIKNGLNYWAHVGDSRLYLFRSGKLIQITEDHTYVNMLTKVRGITAEAIRDHPLKNILTHCIGCLPLEISTGSFEVLTGDLVLLSSDGLHHEIEEDRMISILSQKTDLPKKCESLLRAALEAGGRDNVTIVGLLIQ